MIRATAVALVALTVCADAERAQAETADSLVARLRELIAVCDSQITDATYITQTTEKELRDDGSVKSVKVYKSRHWIRGEETREVLEAMWEDGEPVSDDKLGDERRKRDQERVKRRKRRTGHPDDDDDHSERSQKVLAALRPEHARDYTFPELVADHRGDIACWKLTVAPVREDENLVKGYIWVEQESGAPVAEEYDLAKRPGALKEFGIQMDYMSVGSNCAMVRRVHISGRGKALFVIKFNFDAEVIVDSFQVNVGFPDSLLALPDNR